MTLLDRYIAKQFTVNTVLLIVIIFSFVLTIDVALNLDRFIQSATARLQAENPGESVSAAKKLFFTIWLIGDIWFPRLLQLFSFLIGLILIGSMGFTLTQMLKHRELIAVMASGQSLRRVALPILVVAGLFLSLQVVNQEVFLPRVAHLLTRDPGDAGKHELGQFEIPMIRDAGGNLMRVRVFDPETQTVTGFHLSRRNADQKLTERIFAPKATFDGTAWQLTNAEIIPIKMAAAGSSATDAAPQRVASMTIETDITPTRLLVKRYDTLRQSLSTGHISSLLATLDPTNPVREGFNRVRFGRFSMLIASMIALVITMPFFLQRIPGNMVVQSLKCAPVAIAAIVLSVVGTTMDIPGLPAAFEVFVPLLILTPIAIATSTSLRT